MTAKEFLVDLWLIAENAGDSAAARGAALASIQKKIRRAVPDLDDLIEDDGEGEPQGRRGNGLFDFKSTPKPKLPARKKQKFYVDFEDAEGNTRALMIEATDKKAAISQARQWMRDEGENLRGATFTVEKL